MTQKDKKLLLKDLCARLPYGVKVQAYANGYAPTTLTAIDIKRQECIFNFKVPVENCLPYLRPMASMTEKEKKDILQSLNIHGDIDNEGNLLLGVECDILTLEVCKKYLGQLNKRMFDVCHMIEKGLALEAPKNMYSI